MRRAVALLVVATSWLGATSASSQAAPSLTWQQGAHVTGVFDVVGPRADGRLVVAAKGGLFLLDAAGSTTRFAPSWSPAVGPEAYVAMSPGLHDAAARCGFARGAIAALDVKPDRPGVTLIGPTGRVGRLATVLGVTGLYGVAFDQTGRFGHEVLVVGRLPRGRTRIAAIDCRGHVRTVGIVGVPLEGGIAVAPPGFGRFGGDLIAPNELDGSVYAVTPAGRLRVVASSGLSFGQDIGVESLGFVPSAGAGTAYLADRSTPGGKHPGDDRVLTLSGASLRAAGVQPGDLLGATEGGAATVAIRCTAACVVTTLVPVATAAHGEGSLLVVSPAATREVSPRP